MYRYGTLIRQWVTYWLLPAKYCMNLNQVHWKSTLFAERY
jgi:hypothetical protein